MKRVVVSLVALIVLVALDRVPLSRFITRGVFDLADPAVDGLTLLGGNVQPLVVGFGLVELIALMVPALRARRVGGAAARRGLDFAAFGLAIFFAIPSRTTPTIAGATFVATMLVWAIAAGAGRYGLVSGIGLTHVALGVSAFSPVLDAFLSETLALGPLLLGVAALAGLSWFIVVRSRRSITGPIPIGVSVPVSGVGVSESAAAVLSLLVATGALAGARIPIDSTFPFAHTLIAVGWCVVSGLLFFQPSLVAGVWTKWNPTTSRDDAELAARSVVPNGLRDALIVTVAPFVVLSVVSPLMAVLATPVSFATLVALDAVKALKFQRVHGAAVTIFEFQRLPEADALVHRLAGEGIEATVRSAHFRAALQFFGSVVPLEVQVPVAKREAALEVVKRVG